MEPRKQAILNALDKFVRQRAGLEFGNYGDVTSYRGITKDLHHYRELERYVTWRDSITADMLLEAARSAYSGRLTLNDNRATYNDGSIYFAYGVDYCTGQYFPTEYRRAACAVLAAAIWAAMRADMPSEGSPNYREQVSYAGRGQIVPPVVVDREREYRHGSKWVSAGDWLRSKARAEFGRGIASRWFS